MADDAGLEANADRFSGFADLYDGVRPEPPEELAGMLAAYAGGTARLVIDLGCGTGLSSRWAAGWADEVVGVEPSGDMRRMAEAQPLPNVRYVEGWAHETGLPAGNADVVVAVQAMHWMEPTSTLAEVSRVLRPGGVFAAIDCDWPPTVGSAVAEAAWASCRRRLRVFEVRLADGERGEDLRRPVDESSPDLAAYSARDAHRNRRLARGVRSWSKDDHLTNLTNSGRFVWCHEIVSHRLDSGDAARFVDLLRSQGDYQSLRREGLDDDILGVSELAELAEDSLGPAPRRWLFSYRTRIGVTATD